MVTFSLIRVWRVLCCVVTTALVSSCSDPPEMLEYQKNTEQLQEVVRDSRKDVQKATDELRALQMEKRNWDKDTGLDALRAEVKKFKEVRDAAQSELNLVVGEFETMKETRLP